MEYLALPAVEAITRLQQANKKFKLCYTIPLNKYFQVDDNRLYVVRVKQHEGILELKIGRAHV